MVPLAKGAHVSIHRSYNRVPDPLQLGRILWPDVHFYDKQQEIVYSVWNNDETFVVAGNMLGGCAG